MLTKADRKRLYRLRCGKDSAEVFVKVKTRNCYHDIALVGDRLVLLHHPPVKEHEEAERMLLSLGEDFDRIENCRCHQILREWRTNGYRLPQKLYDARKKRTAITNQRADRRDGAPSADLALDHKDPQDLSDRERRALRDAKNEYRLKLRIDIACRVMLGPATAALRAGLKVPPPAPVSISVEHVGRGADSMDDSQVELRREYSDNGGQQLVRLAIKTDLSRWLLNVHGKLPTTVACRYLVLGGLRLNASQSLLLGADLHSLNWPPNYYDRADKRLLLVTTSGRSTDDTTVEPIGLANVR